MKKSNKHIFKAIVLLVVFSGCSIVKTLKRESARIRERKEIDMTRSARTDQTSFSERGILFNDSSRNDYRVLIFPQDSFSFSVEQGFRGKAQKIEILGSSGHLARGRYYQLNLDSKSADSSGSFKENSRIVERVVAKNLEKRHRTRILALLIAGIIIAACCWWRFHISNRL